MNVHKNARLTPKGREAMVRSVVEYGLTRAETAHRFNSTIKTVSKWVRRYLAEGLEGLRDRSSCPHNMPSRTPLAIRDAVEALRRKRRTQDHIARELALSSATVSRILKRRGISLLSQLEPKRTRPRYERETPGEIIHIDIKKLNRFNRPGHRVTGDRHGHGNTRKVGSDYVHVAIDDHSRVAFSDIFPNEKKESAITHLHAAIAYYESLGVTVTRVMTDNGPCYISHAFRKACAELGIKHIRTKPYTPQTNGKAERFIQSAIREWAYAIEYEDSDQRNEELPKWQHHYNWHRPHSAVNKKSPITRLGLNGNNLLQSHN